jgi:hypothetical protein
MVTFLCATRCEPDDMLILKLEGFFNDHFRNELSILINTKKMFTVEATLCVIKIDIQWQLLPVEF